MKEKSERQELLDSYNLTTPLPDKTRKYITNSEGRQFDEIMKRAGEHGFWDRVWVKVFFWWRRVW